MKNLVTLVSVGIKDDHGVANRINFAQYHDTVSGAEEYKVIYANEMKEKVVTKEEGNRIYKEVIKNAYFRIKVV